MFSLELIKAWQVHSAEAEGQFLVKADASTEAIVEVYKDGEKVK